MTTNMGGIQKQLCKFMEGMSIEDIGLEDLMLSVPLLDSRSQIPVEIVITHFRECQVKSPLMNEGYSEGVIKKVKMAAKTDQSSICFLCAFFNFMLQRN